VDDVLYLTSSLNCISVVVAVILGSEWWLRAGKMVPPCNEATTSTASILARSVLAFVKERQCALMAASVAELAGCARPVVRPSGSIRSHSPPAQETMCVSAEYRMTTCIDLH
jgi:hypothetical protein